MSDPIQPLTPAEEQAALDQAAHESTFHRDAVAVDVCANVLLGGNPDETISSRMARWDTQDGGVRHEVGRVISEGLDLIEHNHGAKAEAADLERAQAVERIESTTGTL